MFKFTTKTSDTKFKGTSIEPHFIRLISKKRKFAKGSNSAINKITLFLIKAACIIYFDLID